MAQKILLVFLITFTGRNIQSASRLPFSYVRAGKRRALLSYKTSEKCKLSISDQVQAYKSLNCFYQTYKGKQIYKSNKTKIVFFSSNKTKPQSKGSMAFIIIPLKKWGTLYFEEL